MLNPRQRDLLERALCLDAISMLDPLYFEEIESTSNSERITISIGKKAICLPPLADKQIIQRQESLHCLSRVRLKLHARFLGGVNLQKPTYPNTYKSFCTKGSNPFASKTQPFPKERTAQAHKPSLLLNERLSISSHLLGPPVFERFQQI